MKRKRFLSLILSLLLIITPYTGLAEEFDFFGGDFVGEEAFDDFTGEIASSVESDWDDNQSHIMEEHNVIDEQFESGDFFVPSVEESSVAEFELPLDTESFFSEVEDEAVFFNGVEEETRVFEVAEEEIASDNLPVTEEESLFKEKYVRVNKGSILYEKDNQDEIKGSFTEDAIVYAIAESDVNEDIWYKIVFDTQVAKDADWDFYTGFVAHDDVSFLSNEEMEELLKLLESDDTIRKYEDKASIPTSDFEEHFDDVEIVDVDDTVVFLDDDILSMDIEEVAVDDELDAAAFSITIQPKDVTAVVGEQVSFSIAADGTGLKYNWQTRVSESSSWVQTYFDGYKTATLSFKAQSNHDGRQYRCVVTDVNGNVVESSEATLTINNGPIITEDPKDITSPANETVSFSVTAKGIGLTYNWQTRTSNTGSWVQTYFEGYKTTTLSFKAQSNHNGRQYRCLVSDSNGVTVESKEATLTIVDGPVITENPEDQMVQVNETVTFNVVAKGTGLTYNWQTRTSSSNGWVQTYFEGYKTATLSFKAQSNHNGRQYRCIVTDANGKTAESSGATLTINDGPVITDDPVDQTVQANETVTFTVSAKGTGLKYNWQTRTSTANAWVQTYFEGYKTSTLSFKAQNNHNGRQYRCVVTDANGKTAESKEATLTISSGVVIKEDPQDQEVAVNETATFTVTAIGTGLTYNWQTRTAPTNAWVQTYFEGYKTATLSFKAQSNHNGRQYRCIVKDSSGNTVESAEATLTIKSGLSITKDPEDQEVEVNETATFSVSATGTGLIYNWQTRTASTNAWVQTYFEGYKTNTLRFKAQNNHNGRQYRCVVTDSNGTTVESREATLTIKSGLTIKEDPKDQEVEVNETVTFSVIATGTGLTYNWQTRTASTNAWVQTYFEGYKTSTLSFKAQSNHNGRQYRCIVTDANGKTVESKEATLTIVSRNIVIDQVTYSPITTNTCKVVSYSGTESSLVIPEIVGNQYTVTVIGNEAFYNNVNLVSIDLPDTIEIIGVRAFAGCTNLSSMN